MAQGHTKVFAEEEAIIEEEDEDNVGRSEFLTSQQVAEITPEQNKAIVRRIDWFLLPLFLITQTLQYLDKTALNYAKVFGMDKAMHLTGSQYSWCDRFFLGFFEAAVTPGISLLTSRRRHNRIERHARPPGRLSLNTDDATIFFNRSMLFLKAFV
ncbi:hypothetical protein JCM10212_001472 [Sporobolomyces blumeae]